MGMSLAYGKTLCYKGDYIGINSKVEYIDQNNVTVIIDIKKFLALAKQCKKKENVEYFSDWISLIEENKLSIGVVIIDGMNRIATELGSEKAYSCLSGIKK